MRISELIQLGIECLKMGVIAALFGLAVWFVVYFLIYRLILKGQSRMNIKKVTAGFILFCYIMVVLGVTLFSRFGYYGSAIDLHLFGSYRNAIRSASAVEWRNLILNICMFVPLGILLPMFSDKLKKWWKVSLIGFLFSLFIEIVQIFGRGIFELDDLFNNTVGCMIGFGFYMLFLWICSREWREKVRISRVVLLQLPLLIMLVSFGVIFITYANQEYGNLSCQYRYKIKESLLNVQSMQDFSNEKKTVPVYKAKIASKEELQELAENIFAQLGTGVDESRNDYYDDTIVFYSEDARYNLWIDYAGMTIWYNYFDNGDDGQKKNAVGGGKEGITDADMLEKIREEMKKFYIEIPQDAQISHEESDTEQYMVNVDMYADGNRMLDGSLVCRYDENGSLKSVRSGIITCERYSEVEIMSEQEAFELLKSGKFQYYEPEKGLDISIESVELIYMMDTKGFYRPVWEFWGVINGNKDNSILIPAMMN